MYKKFKCVVHFDGAFEYEVIAENEDEAMSLAEQRFGEEDEQEIVREIANIDVCDCTEMK